MVDVFISRARRHPLRPEALNETSNAPTTVTTSDGREYPLQQKPRQPREEQPIAETPEARPVPKLGPPCVGMQFAWIMSRRVSRL